MTPIILINRNATVRPALCGFILAFLLIVSFGMSGCSPSAAASDTTAQKVYIISPHGVPIRKEFARAFSAWHQQKYGSPADIEWPDRGGTESIKKYLAVSYAHADTCGYDLMFGGGSGVFDDLRDRHYLQAPTLPAEVLAAVPHQIKGVQIRSPDDQWIGATMSNFGIVLNLDRQKELGLPEPKTWEDISAPGWFGQVSVADPSKSGSVRTCYELLLQQYGWEKGWPILVKIFANAETVRPAGSDPADEVGNANAVAGIVIDFFASIQSAKQGKNLVTFIAPEGGTSLDPDPIAMLRGAPHADLANHFIEFVLTPPGQKLWIYKPQTPDGPASFILGRKSVLQALYTEHPDYLSSTDNPFLGANPLNVNRQLQSQRGVFLGDLMRVTLIDNHALLKQTRQAILSAGDPPALLDQLNQLPMTLHDGNAVPMTADLIPETAIAYKSNEQTQLKLKDLWRTSFASHLQEILAVAQKR